MQDLAGREFAQYKIISKLGKGGMATVYRAHDQKLDREVAIKIAENVSADPRIKQRFTAELKLILAFNHPHILPVYDGGEAQITDEKGEPLAFQYIVTQLMAGGTLEDLIQKRRLSLQEIDELFTSIAAALDYAHQRSVVHRDLKPSNILLNENGDAYLTDFGIARTAAQEHLTQSGTVIGTPAYMSPEQWSERPVDSRSDIYALGIMLFEAIAGEKPFQADTTFGMMHKHIYEPIPPLRLKRAGLPRQLELVVEKATAKNPDDRYQSAAQMMTDYRLAMTDPASALAQAAQPQPEQDTALKDKRKRIHLLIKSAEATPLVRRILDALGERFGADAVTTSDTASSDADVVLVLLSSQWQAEATADKTAPLDPTRPRVIKAAHDALKGGRSVIPLLLNDSGIEAELLLGTGFGQRALLIREGAAFNDDIAALQRAINGERGSVSASADRAERTESISDSAIKAAIDTSAVKGAAPAVSTGTAVPRSYLPIVLAVGVLALIGIVVGAVVLRQPAEPTPANADAGNGTSNSTTIVQLATDTATSGATETVTEMPTTVPAATEAPTTLAPIVQPSATPIPIQTASDTPTLTASATSTHTSTPTSTSTLTSTATPTATETATETPTSTPTVTLTRTVATATPTYTETPSGPSFRIVVIRDGDSLTLYLPDVGPMPMENIYVEATDTQGQRVRRELARYPSFRGLQFEELTGPICFHMANRQGSVRLPLECRDLPRQQVFIERLSPVDLLWFDPQVQEPRLVFIMRGDIDLGNCPVTLAQCEIIVPLEE